MLASVLPFEAGILTLAAVGRILLLTVKCGQMSKDKKH